MSDETGEEGIVSGDAFDLAFDGSSVGIVLKVIEGDFAQERAVVRSVIRPATRGILGEIDIEVPVKLVLDHPADSGHGEHGGRIVFGNFWSVSPPLSSTA